MAQRKKNLEKKIKRLSIRLAGAAETLDRVYSDLDNMYRFWLDSNECCNAFIKGIAELQKDRIREMQCMIEYDEAWQNEYGNILKEE